MANEGNARISDQNLQMRLMISNDQLTELMRRETYGETLDKNVDNAKAKFDTFIRRAAHLQKVTIEQGNHVDCLRLLLEKQPDWPGQVEVEAKNSRQQERLTDRVAKLHDEFPKFQFIPRP